MPRPKNIALPETIAAFCEKMDALEHECDVEIFEVHRGEDPFWDSLWDHPVIWSLVTGICCAVLPVAGILAWHISRGGMIF